MRIGIFGGSFDPVHHGHLLLAEQCREQVNLDRILFVPCATGPFKQKGTLASDRDRIEMLELAIGGHSQFSVSKVEIERGETSYTVDSLESFHESYPDDELFLLMGADSLDAFEEWKSPERICELAIAVVVERDRSETDGVDLEILRPFVDDDRFEMILANHHKSRRFECSSSEIRRRTADSMSIRYLVPRAVEKYIESRKLYC